MNRRRMTFAVAAVLSGLLIGVASRRYASANPDDDITKPGVVYQVNGVQKNVKAVNYPAGTTITNGVLAVPGGAGVFLPLAGGTMAGPEVLANSTTALTTGNYASHINSAITATGGVDTANIISTTNTMSATDKVLSIQNPIASELAYLSGGGGLFTVGAATSVYGTGTEFTLGNNSATGGSYALIDFLNASVRIYAVGSLIWVFDANGFHPNANNSVSAGDVSHVLSQVWTTETDTNAIKPLTASGTTLTASPGNNAGNISFSITNSSGSSAVGQAALSVGNGYSLPDYYAINIGDTWAGYKCAHAASFLVDTGNSTIQRVQCLSGANKVQNCAQTTNLVSVVGVAMATVSSGGVVKVCDQGFIAVDSETDCSTAGLAAGSSGQASGAGKVQCTTPPPINSRVGKVATVVASGVAILYMK